MDNRDKTWADDADFFFEKNKKRNLMTNPLQEKIEEFKEKFHNVGKEFPMENVAFVSFREQVEWLTTTLEEVYKAGEKSREPMYEIPCSDGAHNSFWKSVVETQEWKDWEVEVSRRMHAGKHNEKGDWEGEGIWDVDECREVGWISAEHFKDFLDFSGKKEKEKWLKEGEKNGLSRAVEAVKELKTSPDCGQNPDYPADQCTPTCGYNNAIDEAIKSIESLN